MDASPSRPLQTDGSRQIKRFLPQDVNGELEDLVHHAIRPWMKRCLKEHTTTCNHEAKSSNNPILPTRLLFVGSQTHPTPKLVENQNRTYTRYLILSYSWGSSGNHNKVKTLEENYQARLEGIDISELPKTIQDAIEVTRAMGESYIWIDAICIKQDKDPNVSDWDLESPKVGDYYANALCMISAMRAKDSAGGFLTERKLSKYPHLLYGGWVRSLPITYSAWRTNQGLLQSNGVSSYKDIPVWRYHIRQTDSSQFMVSLLASSNSAVIGTVPEFSNLKYAQGCSGIQLNMQGKIQTSRAGHGRLSLIESLGFSHGLAPTLPPKFK
ncbi:Het domain pin-c1 [Fusarium keratoplasticum]|uniref:Het domain pin-c1 n=1 Tax=Fusarium keratoplasticum TaxID=1328300 RepID=A0ACC0QGA9_9HYPO|nr:Het domain pin-c1 [Fusarium keratoplasticum]KAI8652208.1 Het domain pin-c1 [Fusarium keratoplasticum]